MWRVLTLVTQWYQPFGTSVHFSFDDDSPSSTHWGVQPRNKWQTLQRNHSQHQEVCRKRSRGNAGQTRECWKAVTVNPMKGQTPSALVPGVPSSEHCVAPSTLSVCMFYTMNEWLSSGTQYPLYEWLTEKYLRLGSEALLLSCLRGRVGEIHTSGFETKPGYLTAHTWQMAALGFYWGER